VDLVVVAWHAYLADELLHPVLVLARETNCCVVALVAELIVGAEAGAEDHAAAGVRADLGAAAAAAHEYDEREQHDGYEQEKEEKVVVVDLVGGGG
jgi:hypothetical protein